MGIRRIVSLLIVLTMLFVLAAPGLALATEEDGEDAVSAASETSDDGKEETEEAHEEAPAQEKEPPKEADPAPSNEDDKEDKADPAPSNEDDKEDKADPAPSNEDDKEDKADPAPSNEDDKEDKADPAPSNEDDKEDKADPAPSNEDDKEDKADPAPSDEDDEEDKADPAPSNEDDEEDKADPAPSNEDDKENKAGPEASDEDDEEEQAEDELPENDEAPEPSLYQVTFIVTPKDATVVVYPQSEDYEKAEPLKNHDLLGSGTYHYRIAAEGYETVEADFDVRDGDIRIEVQLKEKVRDGAKGVSGFSDYVTVTFWFEGGYYNGDPGPYEVQLKRGTIFPRDELPEPTKEGCTFAGWWYDEIEYTFVEQPFDFDFEVYAMWTEGDPGGEDPPEEEDFSFSYFEKRIIDVEESVALPVSDVKYVESGTEIFEYAVSYRSSAPDVASVDEEGSVSGRSAGTATITATVRVGTKDISSSCTIHVRYIVTDAAGNLTASLPAALFSEGTGGITIAGSAVAVSFDRAAAAGIAEEAGQDIVNLSVAMEANDDVLNVTIHMRVNGTAVFTPYTADGTAAVTVPYAVREGYLPRVYAVEGATRTPVLVTGYDDAAVTFTVPHFSQYQVTQEQMIARIGTETYTSFEDAMGAAIDGDTITLLADAEGNGIQVAQGAFRSSGLTVNFAGFSYEIVGDPVDSADAGSCGFQLLKNNRITFKNGAILSEKGKTLIHNESDLTLSGMSLALDTSGQTDACTLSCTNGSTVIDGSAIHENPAGGCALKVCRYGSCPSVSVTVRGSSVIDGDVALSVSDGDPKDGFRLTLTGGAMTGDIVMDATAKSAIRNSPDKASVTKKDGFAADAPQGFVWSSNGDGTSSLTLDCWLVTFTLNGGTYTAVGSEASSDPVTIKVPKGETVQAPALDPPQEGDMFDGWYLDDATFSQPYEFSVPVAADTVLYAKWIAAVDFVCSASLELKDSVDINIFVDNVPADTSESGYFVKYSADGGMNYTEKEFTDSNRVQDGKYRFDAVASFPANRLTQKVIFTICDSEAKAVKTIEYSVQDYCDHVLANSDRADLKKLCSALMAYGYYAQERSTNGQAEAIHESEYGEAIAAVTSFPADALRDLENNPDYAESAICRGDVTEVSMSLALGSRAELAFCFHGVTDVEATVTVGGAAFPASRVIVEKGNDQSFQCTVKIRGLRPVDLASQIVVKDLQSGTEVAYSPMTYVKNAVQQQSSDGDLCKALYLYCFAAKAYFQ